MTFEDIEFPVYRKYKNGRNYFKILNARSFEEVQFIGAKPQVRQVQASQFPEFAFIRDLVLDYGAMAEAITVEEYEAVRKRCG